MYTPYKIHIKIYVPFLSSSFVSSSVKFCLFSNRIYPSTIATSFARNSFVSNRHHHILSQNYQNFKLTVVSKLGAVYKVPVQSQQDKGRRVTITTEKRISSRKMVRFVRFLYSYMYCITRPSSQPAAFLLNEDTRCYAYMTICYHTKQL